MPRNGSGTYSRTNGIYTGSTTWTQTRDALRNIRVDDHDAHDQDIADALTASLSKDGQTTPTANLPMGGFAHTNVADATARTQYAKVSQVQDGSYLYGGVSAGSANAQTISVSPAITAYANGMRVRFKAGLTNTGATTINVNGVGATAVQTMTGFPLRGAEILAGCIYVIDYDNAASAFKLTPLDKTTIYRDKDGGTIVNSVTETALFSYSLPANNLVVAKKLAFRVFGLAQNTSGASVDYTYRIKFGGTTYFTNNAAVANGSSFPIVIEGEIVGATATTQKAWARVGQFASSTLYSSAALNKDSTTALTLEVSGQMGTANANAKIDTYATFVELT